MNRKILATALIAAMALGTAKICAEADEETPELSLPDMQIQTAPQGTPAYVRHDAVVAEVTGDGIALDAGARQEQPDTPPVPEGAVMFNQPETATISEDTVILTAAGEVTDSSALTVGTNVSVFVDGNTPVTLQYPAKYPASYIVIGDENGFAGVDIDVYRESDSLGMYLNGAKTLALNVGEETEIVPVDGSKIAIAPSDLANRKLAVFYNMTTMSIPPITNPTRIVVLGDAEAPSTAPSEEVVQAPLYAYELTVDGNDIYKDENGVDMIPVRKYAEGLGLEVGWDGELQSVTVGTVPMGVHFRIGENSYAKARMAPFVLEAAPRLVGDTTYVPVSFFEQALEAKVEILNACPPEAIDSSLAPGTIIPSLNNVSL